MTGGAGEATAAPPAGSGRVRPAPLVLALALGVTTLSLLQSLVVPVLGSIAAQLHVSAGAAGGC